jgi:hypothetical protein
MSALLRHFAAVSVVLALAAPSSAQDGALGRDEAKVRWVDGRPMLRVTLRAGDNVYYCHLLIDLSTSLTLYLHRNAAGSLKAESCTVEAGGIKLEDLSFEAEARHLARRADRGISQKSCSRCPSPASSACRRLATMMSCSMVPTRCCGCGQQPRRQ